MPHLNEEEIRELRFKIVSEGWNEYELADGTILLIRPIIFKVFERSQMTSDGHHAIGFAATNIANSIVRPDLMKKSKSKEGKSEKTEEIDVLSSNEIWNTYELDNSIKLRVKLIVSRVIRTPKYNQFGEPIYHVTSTNVADIRNERKAD